MIKNNNINKLITAVLIAGVFALISVFIFSLVMYFFDFPLNVEDSGLYILLSLTLFLSAVYSGKKTTSKGYLYGIISGIIFILILLLINILINLNNFNFTDFIIKIPALLIISLIGGIFGANLKK